MTQGRIIIGEKTEMNLRACYAKSVADFLQEQLDRWLREMKENFQTVYGGFDLSNVMCLDFKWITARCITNGFAKSA